MKQPFSEADCLSQVLQVDFDIMLRGVLVKYHSFPGFALLLGGLLRYTNANIHFTFLPEIIASLYLGRQRGEGYIFDDTGLSGLHLSDLRAEGQQQWRGTPEFLTYFAKFLESPERSGAHAFDQQRYTTASRECLQLCLCNPQKFSRVVAESAHRDKALRRNKPLVWTRLLGVHGRIKKTRHELTVRQWKSLKAIFIDQYASFPHDSPEHDFYRSLSYRWSLNLLPFFLERSTISLELVEVLDRRTFTTMAQKFPRRMRLAKEAIVRYLLRVEQSGVGEI
jgi:hypothetical protein